MKKFLVLYSTPADGLKKMAASTKEEMTEAMKPWMMWKEKMGDGVIDFGTPLMNGQKLAKAGHISCDCEVNGYSIIQAEDKDAAMKMVAAHPHLDWHEANTLEVFEMEPHGM